MADLTGQKPSAKIIVGYSMRPSQEAADPGGMPYTGTFAEVFLADPRHESVNHWIWSEERQSGAKPPIAQSVAGWILKRYPDAWEHDVAARHREVDVLFVGFNPARFLKILGIECSMPPINKPLPIGMWVDGRHCCNIGRLVVPSEHEDAMTLPAVLRQRGLAPADGWIGPCRDAREDARLAAELATQVGIL